MPGGSGVVAVTIGLQLMKSAGMATALTRRLAPLVTFERGQRDGEAPSDHLLWTATRRVRRLPQELGLAWALCWGAYFPLAGYQLVLHPPPTPAGRAQGLAALLLMGLAAFCASYALLTAILRSTLVPVSTALSRARLERGIEEEQWDSSFKRGLLIFSHCVALAPTAWLTSGALLAGTPFSALGPLVLVALLWVPLCAGFVANAWSAPVRAIGDAVEAFSGQADVIALRVPVLEGDELGRLAHALNHTTRRLAESAQQRVRDMAKMKQLFEEAQAALRIRDEFLAVAAHELRTPLTTLLLQLNSAERVVRKGSALSPEMLGRAASKVKQLGTLVSDLLDVGRIQAGSFQLRLQPLSLGTLVQEVAEGFQGASPHSVEVVVPAQDVQVQADRSRLEQVVSNLMENAIKYSPEPGNVRISVQTRGREAVLSVQDSGIGIDPESQPHLFERFFRAQASRQSNIAGLGLGLYICKEVVERHGGHIKVESELGHGSTFFVSLPVWEEQPPNP
jgi:signal transduction histidine kinase